MYTDLSDEGKIELAINFVAWDQPLPDELKEFLIEAGLYDLIMEPDHNARLSESS